MEGKTNPKELLINNFDKLTHKEHRAFEFYYKVIRTHQKENGAYHMVLENDLGRNPNVIEITIHNKIQAEEKLLLPYVHVDLVKMFWDDETNQTKTYTDTTTIPIETISDFKEFKRGINHIIEKLAWINDPMQKYPTI